MGKPKSGTAVAEKPPKEAKPPKEKKARVPREGLKEWKERMGFTLFWGSLPKTVRKRTMNARKVLAQAPSVEPKIKALEEKLAKLHAVRDGAKEAEAVIASTLEAVKNYHKTLEGGTKSSIFDQ